VISSQNDIQKYRTKGHEQVSNLKKIISKKFRKYFYFLAAFYLIMYLMKAPKNFEKILILKTQSLVSFISVKTHFGKVALKMHFQAPVKKRRF